MGKDKGKQSKDVSAGPKSGANASNQTQTSAKVQNMAVVDGQVFPSQGTMHGQGGYAQNFVQGRQNPQNTMQFNQQGQGQNQATGHPAGNYIDPNAYSNRSNTVASDMQNIGTNNYSCMPNWSNMQQASQHQMPNTQYMSSPSSSVMQNLTQVSGQQYTGALNFIQGNNGTSSSQNIDSNSNSSTQMFNSLTQSIQQMNTAFMSRLDQIDNKVSRLDTIEREVSYTRVDVSNLKLENADLKQKLADMERSCVAISDMFDKFKNNASKSEFDVKALQNENTQLKAEIHTLNSKYTKVSDDLLELKTRSMQENLLFFGIAEAPPGYNDNVEEKLRDFLATELNQPEGRINNIVFDRVHRIGRPSFDQNIGRNKPRPIVAKFEKYTDREFIRKEGIELNKLRKGFSVREQYPPEIEDRRRILYPAMRNYAKDERNRVALVRDKLYVNGELHTVEQDPKNPENKIVVKNSTKNSTQSGKNTITESQNDRRYVRPNRNRLPPREQNQSVASIFTTPNNFNVLQSLPNSSDIACGTKQKARSPLEYTETKRYCGNLATNQEEEEDFANESLAFLNNVTGADGACDEQMETNSQQTVSFNQNESKMEHTLGAETSTPNEPQSNSSEQTERTEQVPDQVPANKPPASAD